MKILILTKNKDGKYTRWSESDNEQHFIECVKYFASSCICDDFICYFENYPGCKKPFAVKLSEICKSQNIKMKYGECNKNG